MKRVTQILIFVQFQIIIAACAFLTPYFAYIPTTAVAAVIIAAMIFTLEIEILLPIWKSKSKLQLSFLLLKAIVKVVSTVMSGILFACFPTVDYVTQL